MRSTPVQPESPRPERDAAADGATRHSREPVPAALVERFRELLQGYEHPDQTELRARGGYSGEAEAHDPAQQRPGEPDVPALVVAHEAMATARVESAAQLGDAQPAALSATLADLLEKHVRRFLVGEPGRPWEGPAPIMLKLADDTLGGATLWLQRDDAGQRWRLTSQGARDDVNEALRLASSELSEQFAARGLGAIDLELA